MNLIIKDEIKSGIIFITFTLPNLSFSLLHDLFFKNSEITNFITKPNLFLFIVINIISLIIILYIIFSNKSFKKINNLLNIFFSFLFVTTSISFIINIYNNDHNVLKSTSDIEYKIKSDSNYIKRDIYFIVFDSYTNNKSLKTYWNYDNKEIKTFLINNSFYMLDSARSNYDYTLLSIGSILNLSYYEEKDLQSNINNTLAHSFLNIKKNYVCNFLNKINYMIYNLSPFDINETKKFYDPQFFNNQPENIFNYYLNKTSFGKVYQRIILETLDKANLRIYEELIKIIKEKKSPKFVYAHFMLPHDPFFFDRNGNKTPETFRKGQNSKKNKWNYLEQLIFTNSLIKNIVNSIKQNSTIEPIIIIQGDHGYRFLDKNKHSKNENHSILFSVYFPDRTINNNQIEGVNLFRYILNNYFNFNFSFLSHKEWFVPVVED